MPPLLKDQPSRLFLGMIDLCVVYFQALHVLPWLEILAISRWLVVAVSMSCFLDALETSF